MNKVEVVSRKGHESFEFGTPDEAREWVENFIAQGGKYWILDKETKTRLANAVGIKANQTIVLIPVVAGG